MASVFIMCNPLVDLIVQVPHDRLPRLGAAPGSMNLVGRDTIDLILAEKPRFTRVPGGSGANTARGLAWLAGTDGRVEKPVYLGAVGNDEEGRGFRELLEKAGVQSALAVKDAEPTGVSAVLVTPDRERTMFTFLGACRRLDARDLRPDLIRGSRYLYLTGYNWDTDNQREAAEEAARTARGAGRAVCLDVADPFVAVRYRDRLLSWIPGGVDILFANRDELRALTGEAGSDEDVVHRAADLAPLVVMKTGRDGCIILPRGGGILRIPGEPAVPRDTTAAGDSFAAGFLFGLLLGRDLSVCGRLANRVASGMVTVEGCNYDLLDRKKALEALG